jgi:hypothetical protein
MERFNSISWSDDAKSNAANVDPILGACHDALSTFEHNQDAWVAVCTAIDDLLGALRLYSSWNMRQHTITKSQPIPVASNPWAADKECKRDHSIPSSITPLLYVMALSLSL